MSERASSRSASSGSTNVGLPTTLRCERCSGAPERRATSIISPTASITPSASLRTWGTNGAPKRAASLASSTSSSVSEKAPGI
jgi:hypothetical protein